MKICLALESVPELSELSPIQKRAVLFYYTNIRRVVYGSRFSRFIEDAFVGLIILAEIAGSAGGFIYWPSFWGPLAGGLIAMMLVIVGSYFIYTYLTVPKFRIFLRSEEGQSFIGLLKKQNEANAA